MKRFVKKPTTKPAPSKTPSRVLPTADDSDDEPIQLEPPKPARPAGTPIRSLIGSLSLTGALAHPQERKEPSTALMPIPMFRPEEKTFATPYTLKADLDLTTYTAPEMPNPDYEPPLRRITGIRLTWLTADEIQNMATVVVRNSKLNGPGSIYDPCFGTITNHEKCPICSQSWRECPGHTGVIKLPYPIPHPVCLKRLADILTCFCEHCHRLVLTWKQMRTFGILEYRRENRVRAFLDLAKKTVRCSNCRKPHGKYQVVDDKFLKCYKKRADVKFPLTYDEVVAIILNIRDQEVRLLGIRDPLCHPRHMIIFALCVLPSSGRPWVMGGSGCMHDDLTHKYIEIQKKVAKLEDPLLKEKAKHDVMDDLMFHVKTLLDNKNGKARDVNGKRNLRSIKQRISGKNGMVRMNIQGKRTVESARSVISPDPDLHVNDVGVPRELTDRLMYPEHVTKHNLAHCQQLLDEGHVLRILIGNVPTDARFACFTRGFKLLYGDVVYRDGKQIIPDALPPGANFQLHEGDSVLRTEETELPDGTVSRKKRLVRNVQPPRRKPYRLEPGYVIERKLNDGDYAIFNRQPSEPCVKEGIGRSLRSRRINSTLPSPDMTRARSSN